MNVIFRMLGGSHSYGLNTPASDVDNRGVFLNEDLNHVLGLDKHEHQEYTEGGADDKLKEFRRYLNLLRQGNTEALEMLFSKEFTDCSPLFALVRRERFRLCDSERLFKSLSGYMQGELKLANGAKSGTLGKRRDSILDHQFSEKNFVQLFRLSWAGKIFFQKGYFPVNVKDEEPDFAAWLLELKTQPRDFHVSALNERAALADAQVKEAFDNRSFSYKFDTSFANELMLRAYYPMLNQAYGQLQPDNML